MKQTVFRQATTVAALAAVLCAAVATPLKAEENVLTLRNVIAIAREHNGELKALREEAGIGEAGKIKAGLFPNPVLELEGATGELTGSESEERLSVGISQEFVIGGKREKRLAVADAEATRFQSRIKDAERVLLLELKSGFHDLLLAERRLDLAHKAAEFNSQLLQIARERFAAGDIAELDVNLARVETARSEGRRIEMEHELVPLRQRLLSLMGTSDLENLRITDTADSRNRAVDLAELKALALKNRPDLQALTAESSKGEAELNLALAERLPNITAGLAYSRERSVTSFNGLDDRSTEHLIGLNLSVPLPLFDRNQAALQEARVRKNSSVTRETYARQNIEREVAAAHGRLASADRSLNIYASEIIPQLTENLKVVQEAYRLGEVGILAVIEEQTKFIDVNEEYLSAHYSRNSALAKLEAAVGMELNEIDGGKQ